MYRTLHHFIIDVKVSYILYETIDSFVNYPEVWNNFNETLDSFADDLKVWYYLCGTFQHFLVSVKVSKNVDQTTVAFVHHPKVSYHFYRTFCTFYSTLRFRKMLANPLCVSYTIRRLHSFVHLTIHQFIIYAKVF